MRESLDWLRDELVKIYELQGAKVFKDVWAARNDYIKMILSPSDNTQWEFFERYATRQLTHEEVDLSLKLLEIERHAMLMYTSCGWFFNDISGIETVQILRYAARAIQLASEITQKPLEAEFLRHLAKAKSNVPEFKTGRGVYQKLVKTVA